MNYSALLNAHDIRPTANRIVIVKALASAMRPMSLVELEHAIGTIDKIILFRFHRNSNLNTLIGLFSP